MDYQRITLRIPTDLHKKIMELAEKSSKSMNAEVIARLQNSIEDSNNFDESKIKDLLREVIREEFSKQ